MQLFLYDTNMAEMYQYHGLTGTPTYHSWYNAIRRCTDPTNQDWTRSGGRGVTMCDGMRHDLNKLVDAIGIKPKGMTLDRIDNDKGYWCGDCKECVSSERGCNIRWATIYEQANNQSSYKNNTTGASGVNILRSGRYHARIYNKGTRIVVGTYDTMEEAVEARKNALYKLY